MLIFSIHLGLPMILIDSLRPLGYPVTSSGSGMQYGATSVGKYGSLTMSETGNAPALVGGSIKNYKVVKLFLHIFGIITFIFSGICIILVYRSFFNNSSLPAFLTRALLLVPSAALTPTILSTPRPTAGRPSPTPSTLPPPTPFPGPTPTFLSIVRLTFATYCFIN